jgi:hypothetical protein
MDDGSNYGEDCAQLSQLHDLERARMQKIIDKVVNIDDPMWSVINEVFDFYHTNFQFILKYAVRNSPFILNNTDKI